MTGDLLAELERLESLQLGHTRADIKLRIRRAKLRYLRHECRYCGALPDQQCVTEGGKRATHPHSARRHEAVLDTIGRLGTAQTAREWLAEIRNKHE